MVAPVEASVFMRAAVSKVLEGMPPVLRRHVVLVVAGIDVYATVFNLEDTGGQAVDEVAIMRDEQYGAGEVVYSFQQHVFRTHVEMVGGLVEQ